MGLGEKVDVFFVVEARGDAVADTSEGIWEAGLIFRVVASETVKHTGVEGIEAEDPIQLVHSILPEAVWKVPIVGEMGA
jgi:hypothetical protein